MKNRLKKVSGKRTVLPNSFRIVEKTLDEYRKEAYSMWLPIFERESAVLKNVGDVTKNYTGKYGYELITPYGNSIPLSWLEINVLEEYMAKQLERLNKEKEMEKL
ncbi:MAG: hypothetical protein FWF86_09340 [Clostridia bacterium]|nr:hypothetical protein [Clostridia bacterium]